MAKTERTTESQQTDFAEREVLPGQLPGDLVSVRCTGPKCDKSLRGYHTGQTMLLGRFYPGTKAEIICSRCGHLNRFVISQEACSVAQVKME